MEKYTIFIDQKEDPILSKCYFSANQSIHWTQPESKSFYVCVCVCKIWQTDSKFYTEKQKTETYQNSFEDWRMCEGL